MVAVALIVLRRDAALAVVTANLSTVVLSVSILSLDSLLLLRDDVPARPILTIYFDFFFFLPSFLSTIDVDASFSAFSSWSVSSFFLASSSL